MRIFAARWGILMLLIAAAAPAAAAEEGTVTTLWPLFDYRSSPATGYSNLSILGPIFKREHSGDITRTAIRPLFFNQSDKESDDSDILYPLASTSSGGGDSSTQIMKIYQKHVSRAGTSEEKRDSMLFPFYISGESEKYGPYQSFFPIHGDIYQRFWRDEYHYTLFPLYGRTVKNGTTTNNLLYPFFNTVSGENESGFQFWPLYGQSAKQGVYSKQFVFWPFYIRESLGLNGDNPTENLSMIPFYASSTSPKRSSTHTPWPFCGVVRDGQGQVIERDIFWPFWVTAQGKDYSIERFIPFYAKSKVKDSTSDWLMWPIYRHETIDSASFRQDKTSLFYFLFSRSDESWPELGKDRARSGFWPLYAWKRDEAGVRLLTMPALTEAVITNDRLERNWAPLWRLFIAQWDDKGNNAVSLLWNLYWQEQRGEELAWELSPLVSYRSTVAGTEFKLLKGLFGYGGGKEGTSLRLFWIPFKL
ncbi:MAG: hypothetical protein GJV46_09975 [Geobacter sp.]|nr:hypothetical protein [Geobacter sp.]